MKTSVLLSWEVPDSYKSAVPFKVGEVSCTWHTHTAAVPHCSPSLCVCVCHAGSRLGVGVCSAPQAHDGKPHSNVLPAPVPCRFCTTGRVWRWMGTLCGS